MSSEQNKSSDEATPPPPITTTATTTANNPQGQAQVHISSTAPPLGTQAMVQPSDPASEPQIQVMVPPAVPGPATVMKPAPGANQRPVSTPAMTEVPPQLMAPVSTLPQTASPISAQMPTQLLSEVQGLPSAEALQHIRSNHGATPVLAGVAEGVNQLPAMALPSASANIHPATRNQVPQLSKAELMHRLALVDNQYLRAQHDRTILLDYLNKSFDGSVSDNVAVNSPGLSVHDIEHCVNLAVKEESAAAIDREWGIDADVVRRLMLENIRRPCWPIGRSTTCRYPSPWPPT